MLLYKGKKIRLRNFKKASDIMWRKNRAMTINVTKRGICDPTNIVGSWSFWWLEQFMEWFNARNHSSYKDVDKALKELVRQKYEVKVMHGHW